MEQTEVGNYFEKMEHCLHLHHTDLLGRDYYFTHSLDYYYYQKLEPYYHSHHIHKDLQQDL
jgi:hypothetical protein